MFLFETRKIQFDICLFVCFRKDPVFEGSSEAKGIRLESSYISGKLPTYPSPKPTFCPEREVSVNVGLGER